VLSDIAGRLLTSPLAFLLAGLVDLFLYAGGTMGRSVRSRADRTSEWLSKIAAR
jgi:hypothetical protein